MRKNSTAIYFYALALAALGIIFLESGNTSVLLAFQNQQEANVTPKTVPVQANATSTNSNVVAKPAEPAKAVSKRKSLSPERSGGFSATAYCLRGRTANGGSVRRGIVAADRKVLPLGTKIYVSAGKYSGNYVVTDTGGKIRGRILDIWVPNCSEAIRFGRRRVGVTVLGRG